MAQLKANVINNEGEFVNEEEAQRNTCDDLGFHFIRYSVREWREIEQLGFECKPEPEPGSNKQQYFQQQS